MEGSSNRLDWQVQGGEMRVFIGGVMQASNRDKGIVDQSYRRAIAESLLARWPGLEVIDPVQLHPESMDYDADRAKATLLALLEAAANSHLLIAYVPTASMGTALEMYAAFRRGVPVVAISPMSANWVVLSLARKIYEDLDCFLEAVRAAESPADLS